jgi:diguanylate cyclase (GGDEF)-like protein
MAEINQPQIMETEQPTEQAEEQISVEDPEVFEQEKVEVAFDSMKSELANAELPPDKKTALLENLEFLEASYRRMEELATKDQLTGLDNRRYFELQANAIIGDVARGKIDPESAETRPFKNFTLMFLDLDNFKKVNDTYGHKAGDAVLQKLGSFLNQRFRKTDLKGRYGGEEMVVGLNNLKNEEGAIKVADKIRKEIKELEVIYDGHVIKFTVSIGLADCETCSNFKNLLLDADEALYAAKNGGKDMIVSAKELKEGKIESARAEIRKIKEIEIAKKEIGDPYETHFDMINPDDLTENELFAYHKFTAGKLKPESLAAYDFSRDPENQSAKYFFQWLRSKQGG